MNKKSKYFLIGFTTTFLVSLFGIKKLYDYSKKDIINKFTSDNIFDIYSKNTKFELDDE